MALLPKVKLKMLPTFPSNIIGGIGIDARREHGAVTIDMDWGEFGIQGSLPTSPTNNVLTFDPATDSYVMIPSHLLGGAVAGISEAPIDGFQYGRESGYWTRIEDGNFTQAGTGAVTRTMQDKVRESVSVRDFGAAVGATAAVNTAAFQAALDSMTTGGTVIFPTGGNFTINSITVPRGVALKGPYTGIGAPGMANYSPPYDGLTSLRLTSGATITLSGGSAIEGVFLAPAGMTFQQTSVVWTGTAITVMGDDVTIATCMIMGFATGIDSTIAVGGIFDSLGNPTTAYPSRHRIRDCNMDNLSCIAIRGSDDISYLENIHCWPFATIAQNGLTTLRRSGTGFNFLAGNGVTRLINCLAYGYNACFQLINATGIQMLSCVADSTSEGFGTGFAINGTCTGSVMTSCQSSGHANGIYIATSGGFATEIINCQIASNTDNGIYVAGVTAGDVLVSGGSIAGGSTGINIASSSALVSLDGVTFTGTSPVFASVTTSRVLVSPNCLFNGYANGSAPVHLNVRCPTITASGAGLSLPTVGDNFQVAGTDFGSLNGGWAGRTVRFIFTGSLTVFSSTGIPTAMRLSGGAFSAVANSTLTLFHNGAQWFETGRSP